MAGSVKEEIFVQKNFSPMKTAHKHLICRDENLCFIKIRGKIYTRSEREELPFY